MEKIADSGVEAGKTNGQARTAETGAKEGDGERRISSERGKARVRSRARERARALKDLSAASRLGLK